MEKEERNRRGKERATKERACEKVSEGVGDLFYGEETENGGRRGGAAGYEQRD